MWVPSWAWWKSTSTQLDKLIDSILANSICMEAPVALAKNTSSTESQLKTLQIVKENVLKNNNRRITINKFYV